MRLLIVSQMPHHLRDGRVVGWGPTVRELDHLASRFERVRHIATLHEGPAPDSALPYSAPNLELVPIPPSGGIGVRAKLGAARKAPGYIRTIRRELQDADVVHVRAPAGVALIAMLTLAVTRHPRARWIKYAGNWSPKGFENPSYALQRWWLARPFHGSVVTVNGTWPDQPPWVRTFFNPSLEDEDIERGRATALSKRLAGPMRLLYVGRVETPKGAGRAIEILAALRARGVAANLELIGDGDERAAFESRARTLGLADAIEFRGWQPIDVVKQSYARSHVLLLPTAASEGWPKVLSEGMAYGVVPVAGAVSSIPQYLKQFGTGAAVPADDIDEFVRVLELYAKDPARWQEESRRAVAATSVFSYRHYLQAVDELLSGLRS